VLDSVEVTFPDGTRVRASSIFERDENAQGRDFGLYLDSRWEPTWQSDIIDWADLGVPTDGVHAATQIQEAVLRAKDGQGVEIGRLGGTGRAGAVLACMAVLAGVDPLKSVQWVRENYRSRAVGTTDQETWALCFSEGAQRPATATTPG
jgi:hypothetical protein